MNLLIKALRFAILKAQTIEAETEQIEAETNKNNFKGQKKAESWIQKLIVATLRYLS